MQKWGLKILIVFFLAVFIFPATVYARLNKPLLLRADSLFEQKRYTQSFEIYKSLFERHEYTPAMLLKMAYVQEGLNRIAQSAYYLNLYYIATQDESSQTKLQELADKYKLEGYAAQEMDKVFSIYSRYQGTITMGLMSAFAFCFVLLVIQRFWFRSRPVVAFGLLITIATVSLAHLYLGERSSKSIIVTNNTYLMDGPSAGASVVSIVRDGHRVKVLGKKDVWLRVEWGDTEVYIKESNLLSISL